MRAVRRRPSTTEHGHAVSTRGYQSDLWSVERPPRSAPRSLATQAYGGALTEVTPYQKSASARRASEPTPERQNIRPASATGLVSAATRWLGQCNRGWQAQISRADRVQRAGATSQRSGARLMPPTNDERTRSIGPAISARTRRLRSSSNTARISSLARCARDDHPEPMGTGSPPVGDGCTTAIAKPGNSPRNALNRHLLAYRLQ